MFQAEVEGSQIPACPQSAATPAGSVGYRTPVNHSVLCPHWCVHTSLVVGAAGMGSHEAALMQPAPLQANGSGGPFGEKRAILGVEDHHPLHIVLPVWGHA